MFKGKPKSQDLVQHVQQGLPIPEVKLSGEDLVKFGAICGVNVQVLVREHAEQALRIAQLEQKNRDDTARLISERDWWHTKCIEMEANANYERDRCNGYIRANGELSGFVEAAMSYATNANNALVEFAKRVNGSVQTAQAVAEQLPQPAGVVLTNGSDHSVAPEPTLQDCTPAQITSLSS